jgi:Nuclease-related domain
VGISSPGAAARREYERLHADYEEHVLRERRFIGSLILRLQPEPQLAQVWERGASGERIVGARLDRIAGIEVLHDRRTPEARVSIDHVAIGPGGVYVVAAKLSRGIVRPRPAGLGRREQRVFVGANDQTKLIAKVRAQADAIGRALRGTPIPVTAAVCFVDAQWPIPARPFELRGVWIGWPDSLPDLVGRPGLLDAEAMRATAEVLDRRLAPS